MVRFITTYNSGHSAVLQSLNTHWNILCMDPILKQHLLPRPSLTFRRDRNIRDGLVHSHHQAATPSHIFGSKGPKWGCRPCGNCVACANILTTTSFTDSAGQKIYQITHTITCSTTGVVYVANCPCGLLYVGLTSRELRRRTREHVLGIQSAATEEDDIALKTIPRHFKTHHACDSSLLQLFRCGCHRYLGFGVLFFSPPFWSTDVSTS
ncbi:uncharacterized protein LOC122929140 [Bufo gargarizans]|uniref:uncharacterized protein LOC122929140 n=1 Tax=Bufo gargarizans TaxID=30331 RepID=UPI001CF2E4E9|nr:uncharacterized protein LOC122929140 [Bufo gargarizans]